MPVWMVQVPSQTPENPAAGPLAAAMANDWLGTLLQSCAMVCEAPKTTKASNETEDGVPHVLFPFNVRLRGQPIAPAPTARTGLIRASIRRLARLAISRQIR